MDAKFTIITELLEYIYVFRKNTFNSRSYVSGEYEARVSSSLAELAQSVTKSNAVLWL